MGTFDTPEVLRVVETDAKVNRGVGRDRGEGEGRRRRNF